MSEGGKVKSRYIRGNDLVYADKGDNTEKQFYVTDPHGNVVQLTDENGKVVKTYEYDSFGNEVNLDSKDDNPFRYCGEYYDKEMEEIYLRARCYQPAVGRFLTRDMYTGEEDDVLSLHLYTYCGNDGVNAVDPSGYFISKNYVGAKIGTLYGGLGNRFKKYFDNISKGSTNFYTVYAKTSSTDVWKHNYKNIDKDEATSNANYILNYLKRKDWNELSVCAIIGNFFEECHMNPGHWQYWEDSNYGYGLAQWSPATKFFDYAGINGDKANEMVDTTKAMELMDLELEYFINSLDDGISWKASEDRLYMIKTKHGNKKVRKMSIKQFKENKKNATLEELVYIFNAHYEKSGNTKDMVRERRYRPAIDFWKHKKFRKEEYDDKK